MSDAGDTSQSASSKSDTVLARNADADERLKRIELSAVPIGRMIFTISLIAGIISITVVLSVVLIAVVELLYGLDSKIPDVLSNWGGVILGFYFGQFVNLVKDYMGVIQNPSKRE
jgi:hypothetical protein